MNTGGTVILLLALTVLNIALAVLNYSVFSNTGSNFSLGVSYFNTFAAGGIAGLMSAVIMDI